jgi:hypothetical protein
MPAHDVEARALVKLVLEGIAAPCHVIESYGCGEFATLDHGDAGMITTINQPHSKINSQPKQFCFVLGAYSSLAARAKPSTPLSPMVLTRPAVLARMTKQPAISLAHTRCCVNAPLVGLIKDPVTSFGYYVRLLDALRAQLAEIRPLQT